MDTKAGHIPSNFSFPFLKRIISMGESVFVFLMANKEVPLVVPSDESADMSPTSTAKLTTFEESFSVCLSFWRQCKNAAHRYY